MFVFFAPGGNGPHVLYLRLDFKHEVGHSFGVGLGCNSKCWDFAEIWGKKQFPIILGREMAYNFSNNSRPQDGLQYFY